MIRKAFTLTVLLAWSVATVCGQTPASVADKARTAIVMLDPVDLNPAVESAAGLIVGNDSGSIYIAGPAHMLSSCALPFPDVQVRFDRMASVKTGNVKQCDNSAGVDALLIAVARDADTDAFLLRYDPALLASEMPPPETPIYSLGHSNAGPWILGKNETLLPPQGETLRFRSNVGKGQSGGGLFTEAWELIGTPLRFLEGENIFTARPIKSLLNMLETKWSVPVALKPRPEDQRVRGADEVARMWAADFLAERATDSLGVNDVLTAISLKPENTLILRNCGQQRSRFPNRRLPFSTPSSPTIRQRVII